MAVLTNPTVRLPATTTPLVGVMLSLSTFIPAKGLVISLPLTEVLISLPGGGGSSTPSYYWS